MKQSAEHPGGTSQNGASDLRRDGWWRTLDEQADDPAFRRAIDLVSVDVDREVDAAYPEAFGARAVVELVDGRTLERVVMHPKGSGTAGVSDEQVEAKFRNLAGDVMASREIEALIRRASTTPM